ncbi:MAG: hypothetical protein KAX49_10760 [Halanaerobiales bacterium]|nr:hypothetical protein [Halanaerobiales bacterium]
MHNSKKIACLDTDVIIKMSRDELGLLERVLDVFEKCYLHKCVYDEVEWPEDTILILDKLIKEKKIILLTDKDLFEKLGFKRLFSNSLQQACNIFGIEYDNTYVMVEEYLENPDKLYLKLQEIDKILKDNIGELRTLQMIILLRDVAQEKINYFISDDRRARRAIILNYAPTLTEHKLYGISLMSVFYLLKENGMTKEESLEFIDKILPEKSKVYLKNGEMEKMNNRDVIEKLYNEEMKLVKTGEFLLNANQK